MGSVNVTINSRQYRIGCEDGQESHLEELAKDFDARIAELRERIGEVGDARLTIMAALTVADDLSELKNEMGRLKDNIASLQNARNVSAERAQATNDIIAAAFESAAERIETIAKKLNQTLGSPGLAQG